MNDQTDSQLLRAYAENRSEAAFAELVRRHVDFVYSAARRMVCDPHLAEDVTQSVFVAFAKNARQLTDRPVFSGWLHRTAQNIAAQTVRTIERRRAREQEAATMNELFAHEPDAEWENIAPHLDTALGELSEPDRDALLLRYFERKSAREMAQTLGTSEEAAQKRVNRAVERLREFFSKRNVTVGSSGLAVLISANAVQAAPMGLALSISTSALAGATIAATATKIIAMTTLQKTVIAGAFAAIVATAIYEARQISHLRDQNQKLIARDSQLSQERDAALDASRRRIDDSERQRNEKTELLRLRNEVGILRRATNDLADLREENRRLHGNSAKATEPRALPPTDQEAPDYFPKTSWEFAGFANPESTLLTFNWAALRGDVKTALASMSPEMQVKVKEQWAAAGKSESDMAALLPTDNDIQNVSGYRIISREMITDDVVVVTVLQEGRNKNKKITLKRIDNEWKVAN